jgi:hypothetical protein
LLPSLITIDLLFVDVDVDVDVVPMLIVFTLSICSGVILNQNWYNYYSYALF